MAGISSSIAMVSFKDRLQSPNRLQALQQICSFQQETRYATPNHVGYMSMAFAAAHPLCRIATESSASSGWAIFYYSEDTSACRGCCLLHEEEQSGISPRTTQRYLVLTAAPASILEEYLPLLAWWLPRRATLSNVPLQLSMRDSMNRSARLLAEASTHGERGNSSESDEVVQRRNAYTALSLYNAVSLLTSLPRSSSFRGLSALRLVNFPMSPLLWNVVMQAAITTEVLNLSCCSQFTQFLAMEEMHECLTPGSLEAVRALILPATDVNDEVLQTFLAAAPRLEHLNVGETPVCSLSSLALIRDSLRSLFIYAMAKLSNGVCQDVGRCTELRELVASRCQAIHTLSAWKHLTNLEFLDLQGCPQLHSIHGLEGCTALKELWVSGCPRLTDLAPVRHLSELVQLQATHLSLTLPTPKDGIEEVSFCVGDKVATLSVAECPALTFIHGLGACHGLTSLNLSGTSVSAQWIFDTLRPVEIRQKLRILILNGVRGFGKVASSADAALFHFPALRQLSLAGTDVLSEHLLALASSPNGSMVEVLRLDFCEHLTSLKVLPLFRALRILSLVQTTSLTNSSLSHVAEVPFLGVLSIQGSHVTDLHPLTRVPYLRVVEVQSHKVYRSSADLVKKGVKLVETEVPSQHPSFTIA